jgi:hypothetical protein
LRALIPEFPKFSAIQKLLAQKEKGINYEILTPKA